MVGINKAEDIITLLDITLVIVSALIAVTGLVPVIILIDITDFSAILDVAAVLVGITDVADGNMLVDSALVDIIVVIIEVREGVLVLVVILEDLDISSVLNAILVGVINGADVNSLLNVTLVVITEDKGDISLLVLALVDVTDVGNGADDSSLLVLDGVLVTVTVLIEATDSVPVTVFVDIANVSLLLIPTLEDISEDTSSTFVTALLCTVDSADVSSLVESYVVVTVTERVLVLTSILEDVTDVMLPDATFDVAVTDGTDVSSLLDVTTA